MVFSFKLAVFPLSIILLLVVLAGGCGDIDGGLGSLTITPDSTTVGVGGVKQFSAIAYDGNGHIVSTNPNWSVSGGIGTINSSGLLLASATEATGQVIARYGGKTARANVIVTSKGWLSGVIRTPEGGPASGIIVYLKENSSLLDDTDSQGRYSIANIPPGTYEAWTQQTSTYLANSQEVTVASGETVTWSPFLVYKPGVPTLPTTTLPNFGF